MINLTSSSSFDAHGFEGSGSRRPGHEVAAMLVRRMALVRVCDRVISVLLVRIALMEERTMITVCTYFETSFSINRRKRRKWGQWWQVRLILDVD